MAAHYQQSSDKQLVERTAKAEQHEQAGRAGKINTAAKVRVKISQPSKPVFSLAPCVFAVWLDARVPARPLLCLLAHNPVTLGRLQQCNVLQGLIKPAAVLQQTKMLMATTTCQKTTFIQTRSAAPRAHLVAVLPPLCAPLPHIHLLRLLTLAVWLAAILPLGGRQRSGAAHHEHQEILLGASAAVECDTGGEFFPAWEQAVLLGGQATMPPLLLAVAGYV
jgi:hypothetical protein